ncbi:hypothetical protein K1W54_01530 [Micromonospora sp. CPCC 205371]|nr:hypothetical protein [Micromonospora sp. CPCC 205371]
MRTPAAGLLYLCTALWVTARGWRDVDGRFLGSQAKDHSFNEWMLAHVAHAVAHLDNPFFTTRQNAPDGVNLVSNVGNQLVGLLLTPLTLTAGPSLSYLVLITANLAGTAFAWYWVLSRRIVDSQFAAVVGGAFCGFAPALVSHSNGHPHVTAQWLVPFIVWRVVRLGQPGRTVRDGLILGALLAAQFFIGVEILFLLAIGCAVATIGYAILRPRDVRTRAPRALAALGIAAALVLAVTAYPLWMQFFGPQHRIGHPGDPDWYALRLGSYVAYPTHALAGGPGSSRGLTNNPTEESSFFGWPLIVVCAAAVWWLRRDVAVRVLAITGLVCAALSTGRTAYAPLAELPVFDAVVVARFALVTTAAIGVLLAYAIDRMIALEPSAESGGTPLRLAAGTALVAALLPLAPTPLVATGRPPIPDFITSGAWRSHVAPGRTLVPVPVDNLRSIRWSASAGVGFSVPQGYFLGPTSPTDHTGRWNVEPRPTAALLTAVARGDRSPTVTEAERAQAIVDARHWKADAVVLDAHPRQYQLRTVLDQFYGPGHRLGDVWLWNVRPLTT